MKKVLLIGTVVFAGLTSCRKYDCTCTTTVYDTNYNVIAETTDTEVIKARGVAQASTECYAKEYYSTYEDKSCSLY